MFARGNDSPFRQCFVKAEEHRWWREEFAGGHERLSERFYTRATRLSIMRVAARSIIASDV
jgi:hypothetical protein